MRRRRITINPGPILAVVGAALIAHGLRWPLEAGVGAALLAYGLAPYWPRT